MSAWRSAKQVSKDKLPRVFYVKPGALAPYKICSRDLLNEVRQSGATGTIFAELKNGSHVLVSLEKTILEFGAEITREISDDLLENVNWNWIKAQGSDFGE